jgi:hypothetical protein
MNDGDFEIMWGEYEDGSSWWDYYLPPSPINTANNAQYVGFTPASPGTAAMNENTWDFLYDDFTDDTAGTSTPAAGSSGGFLDSLGNAFGNLFNTATNAAGNVLNNAIQGGSNAANNAINTATGQTAAQQAAAQAAQQRQIMQIAGLAAVGFVVFALMRRK